jgi:hypothetical protein
MFRKNQEQPVVQSYGFVNLFVNLFSVLNVMGRDPAAYAFVLQIGMDALGKCLVFARIEGVAGTARAMKRQKSGGSAAGPLAAFI